MRPILLLSLSIIVGICLAFVGAPWYALVPVMLVLGVLRLSHSPGHILLAIALIFVGFLRGSIVSTPSVAPGPLSTAVQAVSTPIFTASGYYRGKVREVTSAKEFLMYWSEPWKVGLRLEVQGEVVVPSLPLNPGELDYVAYLDRQGIQGLLFVRTARPVARFRPSPLESLRGFFRDNLNDLPDVNKGLALAVMLGDRSALSRPEQENWRKAGASHILAVSGLHIGIAAGAVYALARRFTGFRTSWVLASLSALLYAALVGSSASAWRAALAFVLLAVAKIALREAEPLNILALIAALMLLLSPQSLGDPGFLLSFAATLGLVWISPSLKTLLPGDSYMRTLLSATLAAQIATLPIVLSLFGTWPVYGLVSNLLLVPAAILLVGSSLLAGILGRVPGIGALVYAVFSGVAWFFSSVVGWIASLPIASINFVALPVVLIALYYGLLIAFPRVTKSFSRLGAV
ncbi:MAG: ComEC/Rec2 family competence protein, partial [Bacillota bacterium]|nr:ComEC/Rec2 family competence protein [Bacillota bacterium]